MTPLPTPLNLAHGFSESFLQGVYADLLYARGDRDYARSVTSLLETGALERRYAVPHALDPDCRDPPAKGGDGDGRHVPLLPTLRPGQGASPGRRPRLKEPNPGAEEEADAGSTPNVVEHARPRGPNEGGEGT